MITNLFDHYTGHPKHLNIYGGFSGQNLLIQYGPDELSPIFKNRNSDCMFFDL
jgi:hypothetical protein